MEYEYIKHLQGTKVKLFMVEIKQRELHFHNDAEIILVLRGSIVIDLVRENHTLRKGDIFVLNKNSVHSLKRTDEDNLMFIVQFSPEFCKAYYPQITNVRFQKNHVTRVQNGAYWKAINTNLMEIVNCYVHKKEGFTIGIMAYLNHLMLSMLEHDEYVELDDRAASSENRNIDRLGSVIGYMQENYMRNITLRDIAQRLDLDMYYLSHFIKNNLGITFQKYLTRLRVERAEQLLRTTNLRNIDVCLECGFSDYKYMSKAFMESFSCTPAEYRKRNVTEVEQLQETNEQHVIMEVSEIIQAAME